MQEKKNWKEKEWVYQQQSSRFRVMITFCMESRMSNTTYLRSRTSIRFVRDGTARRKTRIINVTNKISNFLFFSHLSQFLGSIVCFVRPSPQRKDPSHKSRRTRQMRMRQKSVAARKSNENTWNCGNWISIQHFFISLHRLHQSMGFEIHEISRSFRLFSRVVWKIRKFRYRTIVSPKHDWRENWEFENFPSLTRAFPLASPSFLHLRINESNELVCCTIPALLVVSRFYSATGKKQHCKLVHSVLMLSPKSMLLLGIPPKRESENRILFSRCISTRHNRENLENTCFLVVNAQNQKSVCALHARQKSAVVCLAIGVVNKYITRIWTRASPITVWARPMRMLNVYSSSKKRVIYIGTALVLIPLSFSAHLIPRSRAGMLSQTWKARANSPSSCRRD